MDWKLMSVALAGVVAGMLLTNVNVSAEGDASGFKECKAHEMKWKARSIPQGWTAVGGAGGPQGFSREYAVILCR